MRDIRHAGNVEAGTDTDRQLRLDWVNPNDLSNVWDTIKPGLAKVRKHGDHWREEDVYMAIKQGASNLHIGILDNRYAGFIVTTVQQSYDGVVLHIWVCYSQVGNLLDSGMTHLREWAASVKARRIVFTSDRKGWERVGERHGFRPTLVTFECEV